MCLLKETHMVLLQQSGVKVHTLTRTSEVDSDIEAPWPRSACQVDIVNFTDTVNLNLRKDFLSLNDIKGDLDSLNIGFGRPSLESHVMIDFPDYPATLRSRAFLYSRDSARHFYEGKNVYL